MQSILQAVQQAYLGTQERAVIVLEGWDTAGKGGIVRRLGWVLDPRSFKVHPISAPSSHERGKHYLQRFWEKLPEHGQIVVFDRSWYGRVLVERVEGFATKRQWRRGYEEINQFERLLLEDGIRIAKIFLHISAGEQIRRFKDRVNNPLKRCKLSYEDFRNRERWEINQFEHLLVEDGIRIAKIFLHISAGEQIRRFKDRINNPLKRWKLSYEDFRNRERWADYEIAIEDMIEKTSTKRAPWYLVPTNDKLFGRIAAFTILIDRLGKGVNLKPRPLDPEIAARAAQLFDLS